MWGSQSLPTGKRLEWGIMVKQWSEFCLTWCLLESTWAQLLIWHILSLKIESFLYRKDYFLFPDNLISGNFLLLLLLVWCVSRFSWSPQEQNVMPPYPPGKLHVLLFLLIFYWQFLNYAYKSQTINCILFCGECQSPSFTLFLFKSSLQSISQNPIGWHKSKLKINPALTGFSGSSLRVSSCQK